MSTLSQELDRYLTIRRSLGYDLGTAERILRKFIAFAEQEVPSTSAPLSSCDGKRRSAMRTSKHGRAV